MTKRIPLRLVVSIVCAISLIAYADEYSESYEYSDEYSDYEESEPAETPPVTTPSIPPASTPTSSSQTSSAGSSAGATESSSKDNDDASAKSEDSTAKSEDSTAKSEDSTAKSEDSTAKSEDTTAKNEDSTAKNEDSIAKSEDSTAKSEDSTAKSEDSTAKSEDSTAKSEDSTAKSEDSTAKSDDATTKSEDSTAKSDDATTKSEDSTSKGGDASAKGPEEPQTGFDADKNAELNWPSSSSDVKVDAKTAPSTAVVIDINAHYDPTSKQKLTVNCCSANAIVADNGDGTLGYIPNPTFIGGIDTFSCTVNKGKKKRSTFTLRVEVERSLNRESFPPADCKLYLIHDEADKNSQLLTLERVGTQLVVSQLGPLYNGINIEGMGVDPSGKEPPIAVSGLNASTFSGLLYTVNPQTGAFKKEFDTGFKNLTALAYRPNGTVWAWSGGGAKKSSKQAGKWSKNGGLIQIDLNNQESHLLFPSPWGKKRQVEGLAWRTDGTVLYASEVFEEPASSKKKQKVYSTRLWQFEFYGDLLLSFKEKCNLRGDKVEALETNLDDTLLLGIHGDDTLYLFDPESCIKTPFAPTTPCDDIESIVWPLACQASPEPVYNWEVTYNGAQEEEVFCDKKPQWLTKTGTVKLYPPESGAYIETYWEVITPQEAQCPRTKYNSKYSVWEIPNKKASCLQPQYQSEYFSQYADCNRVIYQSQLITGSKNRDLETTFRIKGWWPGIPKDADENTLVEVRYGINIYDMDRNPLSVDEISQTLLGGPSVCPKPTSGTNKSKAQQTSKSKAQQTSKSKAQTTNKSKAQTTNKSKAQTTNKSKAQTTNKSKTQTTSKSKAQTTNKSKAQTTNKSKGQTTNKSKAQTTNKSKTQTTSKSKAQTTNKSKAQTTNKSKAQTTNKSKAQTTNKSKAQTTSKSKAQTTNKSKAQTTNKSKTQTTNKSKAQTTNKSKAQTTNKSKAQTTNKSKAQTTNKSKGQTTNKSKAQTTNKSKAQTTNKSKPQTTNN
jgi:hypothetical protein